eukprot:TRINITY_DN3765_c0_g3_i1.p1 TRINITY_DN3765_c0_g3~~TRINITY_DN3765_c0_g3_i1.p1  ORF type:complete len:1133 (-),score=423.25 TRINITY_DN3765_c0_g3_i1:58-3456(-)
MSDPKEYQAEEHSWDFESLGTKYGIQIDESAPKKSRGLSVEEAARRLFMDGKNRLTPPKKTPEIIKFLLQFINPFMILLEIAGLLCILAFVLQMNNPNNEDWSNLYLAISLIAIVIGTCLMSYIQERKSGALMASFTNLLPPKCMVIRDSIQQKIFSEDLVLGDIVVITSGDKIPADIRIIHCQDLKVDNSSLTGESEPQSRNAEISTEKNPLESSNLAFYGTLAVDGSALGLVMRRGDDTLLGQIAGLTKEKGGKTTLELEVKRFVIFISVLAIASGFIFFGIGLWLALRQGGTAREKQERIIDTLVNTIGIIVANVPEGLPATVTICLTIAARRLAKNQVWVKELESVETLGSTTMICSDKTGTLTQNRMTAVHCWYDDEIHDVKSPLSPSSSSPSINGEGPASSSFLHLEDQSCARLFRVAAVCSRAQFEQIAVEVGNRSTPLIERDIIGDASETALLRMCESYFDTIPFRDHFSKVFEIPFNSTNKFQLSIHALPSDLPPVTERKGLRHSVMVHSFKEGMNRSESSQELADVVEENEEDDDELTQLLTRRSSKSSQNEEFDIQDSFDKMNVEAKRMKSRRESRIKQFSNKNMRKEHEKMQQNYSAARTAPQRLVALKGAPEIIIGRCDKIMYRGKAVPLDDEWREKFQATIIKLASGGERILGFAQIEFEDNKDPSEYNIDAKNYPLEGFTFLGLFSLMDPPRPSVPQSIATCRSAGVKVAMVTGDHPLTAKAIAKQIGLLTYPTKEEIAKQRGVSEDEVDESESKSVVITGMQLREWTEEDWEKILNKREFVFARTSPQQKLTIVEHFQSNGEVVAVTGDGVNDSPALKQANIGVAMGIAGSDVAKEAANIILMDDNFSSITKGVEQGRVIFDNLSKSIMYTLSHLLPEVVPFILNMSVNFPLALTTILILFIDLGTELAPAISLAYELPESNIMKRRPRNVKKDRLVSFGNLFYAYIQLGLIETIAGFCCFFYVFYSHGFTPDSLWRHRNEISDLTPFIHNGVHYGEKDKSIRRMLRQGQSAYFISMVLCQAANLIACKTKVLSVFRHGFRNHYVNLAIPISIGLMSFLILVPFMNKFTSSLAPPSFTWVIPLPFMAFIIIHTEIIKLIKRMAISSKRKKNEYSSV